jgi:hypothetical protein
VNQKFAEKASQVRVDHIAQNHRGIHSESEFRKSQNIKTKMPAAAAIVRQPDVRF